MEESSCVFWSQPFASEWQQPRLSCSDGLVNGNAAPVFPPSCMPSSCVFWSQPPQPMSRGLKRGDC
eukprot:1139765-Pelagomonas_calceolata.AAC.2